MAYCHECGSEVAPNDVFCPYCGITLKSVAAANDAAAVEVSNSANVLEDKSLPTENTEAVEIVSSVENQKEPLIDTEIEDFGLTPPSENPVKAESTEFTAETPKIEPTIEAQSVTDSSVNFPFAETAENDSTKTEIEETQVTGQSVKEEFSDIPTPFIIENTESFNISLEKEKQEQENTGNISQELSEKNADSLDTDENLEQLKPAKPVEESQNIDRSLASEVSDFNPEETIPTFLPDNFVSDDVIKNSLADTDENIQISDSTVSEIVEPIAKPADELPEEPTPNASVFDSVRIMESENQHSDLKVESSEIDVPAVEPKQEIISQTPDNVQVSPPVEEKVESYTTPNIGENDTDGKKSAKLKPLEEGTVLNGRYEIIRKIGGGGMGAVYLASDNNLGGVLRAVKEMVQSYIEETQQDKAINDFKRESMILSTLDHPAIPTIYDYFYDEKESRFYLVMKYISGGDLSGKLRSTPEGKIDEKTITEWAIQVADVLNYLHTLPNTIVYRDLKPSNVMIDGNSGRIMLIDFGIARAVNKEEKGVTAVGTMGYAPPELFSGNVEPRSDIYSLGSTMFHLLTGADPQSNPLLIFDFQKNPRPRQINPQLSDQMERILMRSVEYNSSARFTNAAEFKQVLEEHLNNLIAGRVSYGVKEVPPSISLENQTVFCGFCGQKIVATDMYCAFCGSKQPISQKGVHSEIYSHSSVTAKLMLLGTNELDSPIYNLEKDENLIGRRDPMSNIFPEVDLSKYDPQTKISRRHARIRREGGNYIVEDLGSSNGTIVLPVVSDSMRLLPHQSHVLVNGDKIRLGDTTLHFVVS